jgi:hypothetical protein
VATTSSSKSRDREPLQPRTISSAGTFWIKYVFPCVWISAFGTGAFHLWFDIAHGKNGEHPPEAMKYFFAIAWILGTAFILAIALRLKRVRIDDCNLYVSNRFRDVTVPLQSIAKVTVLMGLNGQPVIIRLGGPRGQLVIIHFKHATACGTKVMFLPTMGLEFRKQHPIVAELQKLAGLNPDS